MTRIVKRNDVAGSLIELAFSIFIGLLFVFVVSSALNLMIVNPPYTDSYYDSTATEPSVYAINSMIRAWIAIVISTIALFGSLKIPVRLAVIGNGVLLGGVFTTFYSIAQSWSYGNDDLNQLLITVIALALSIVFGYLKFIKARKENAERINASSLPVELDERLNGIEGFIEGLKGALK